MKCKVCRKAPEDIEEYVSAAIENECTPDAYVRQEEGTYNHYTEEFYCTVCYVEIGMPLGIA